MIPKSFKLGAQEIKVIKKKQIETEGAIGHADFYVNEIQLQTHVNGRAMAEGQVTQTYYHELAHWLMFMCRQEDLCANEPFIDLLGEFLMQYDTTKKM